MEIRTHQLSRSSNIKNPAGFWLGLVIGLGGAVLLYFGIDFENTNLETFVDPDQIGAALMIIGGAVLVIGIVKMIQSYFIKSSSAE